MGVRWNNDLAAWVNQLKGEMSLRQVENRTSIPYSTISNMAMGRVPTAETLIRFATAFHEDVPSALRLAGYDDLAETWETGAAPLATRVDPPELTYEPEFEDLIEAGYGELPADERDEIVELVRLKIAKERRKETTHGKRAG